MIPGTHPVVDALCLEDPHGGSPHLLPLTGCGGGVAQPGGHAAPHLAPHSSVHLAPHSSLPSPRSPLPPRCSSCPPPSPPLSSARKRVKPIRLLDSFGPDLNSMFWGGGSPCPAAVGHCPHRGTASSQRFIDFSDKSGCKACDK